MKARPILFKPDMVRAILDGRKTMTRRIVKPQPPLGSDGVAYNPSHFEPDRGWYWKPKGGFAKCPYGAPGDVLWARETWTHEAESVEACRASFEDHMGGNTCGPYYLATESAPETLRWKPSIHMSRWASRLTLEITDVRVETLEEISEEDAQAEGISPMPHHPGRWISEHAEGLSFPSAVAAFRDLWESINGADSWADNPCVWCVSFKPHHMNVDAFLEDRV